MFEKTLRRLRANQLKSFCKRFLKLTNRKLSERDCELLGEAFGLPVWEMKDCLKEAGYEETIVEEYAVWVKK